MWRKDFQEGPGPGSHLLIKEQQGGRKFVLSRCHQHKARGECRSARALLRLVSAAAVMGTSPASAAALSSEPSRSIKQVGDFQEDVRKSNTSLLRYNNIEIRPINNPTMTSKYSSKRIVIWLTGKLETIKLSEEDMLKVNTGQTISKAVNAKEKFLKEIKSTTTANTWISKTTPNQLSHTGQGKTALYCKKMPCRKDFHN
ncbi:hypothetical protein QTO34_018350 [Cnephaeus nilssonii]|uniref:Uncharacterized protein n=1 Tax=Cnephaeus nilssonii TaxID=3371016 RepID=A0AA40LPX3_CNENI|nr:hypothetical protein QTO34_018350 [Eptesicus nilssonii]